MACRNFQFRALLARRSERRVPLISDYLLQRSVSLDMSVMVWAVCTVVERAESTCKKLPFSFLSTTMLRLMNIHVSGHVFRRYTHSFSFVTWDEIIQSHITIEQIMLSLTKRIGWCNNNSKIVCMWSARNNVTDIVDDAHNERREYSSLCWTI